MGRMKELWHLKQEVREAIERLRPVEVPRRSHLLLFVAVANAISALSMLAVVVMTIRGACPSVSGSPAQMSTVTVPPQIGKG